MRPVSVVINTYNRSRTLKDTLASLEQQDYPYYEVVVVNGPSTDDTESLLATYSGRIKTPKCPIRSLSVSRNIGICAAAGEIIAFLDDDAVADSRWLSHLVDRYDNPSVGAVGGFVFDHTGYTYQSRYNVVDRLGNVQQYPNLYDLSEHCQPGGPTILSMIGTNSSFLTSALVSVGGFDEAYCYFLDETDVCLRLIDAGYNVSIQPKALIYHRYAASFARTEKKIPVTLYPAALCRSYYCFRNGFAHHSLSECTRDLAAFEKAIMNSISWFRANNEITLEMEHRLGQEMKSGLAEGIRKALHEKRVLITPDLRSRFSSPFLRFSPKSSAADKLRICLISDGYPPENYGGVSRWTADLARGMVDSGHEVHVIHPSAGEHNLVEYDDGVFLHKIVPGLGLTAADRVDAPVATPDIPLLKMRSIRREVVRTDAFVQFDVIAWHVWENLGLVLGERFADRSVLFIESAFGLIRPYKPAWSESTEYGREHVTKMVAGEVHSFLNTRRVIAPSQLIVREYNQLARRDRTGITHVIPLGTRDPGERGITSKAVTVLYVGRLENRKGIDLLLEIIPTLLDRHPGINIRICGEDVIENADGMGHRDRFLQQHGGQRFLSQVHFLGHVSDENLKKEYFNCDVFVAPSRFESFGLIYVEAMAYGKPVVALNIGGATEIIRNGVDGFLVESRPESLMNALEVLAADRNRRVSMGRSARLRFEECYRIETMTEATLNVFRAVAQERTVYKPVRSRPENQVTSTTIL